jgi:hypothetical protein
MSNTKMRISFKQAAGVPHKRKIRDQPHRYFRVVNGQFHINNKTTSHYNFVQPLTLLEPA